MVALLERLMAALTDWYRVAREIGRGGVARVFLTHDPTLNRADALNALRPELAGTRSTLRGRCSSALAACLGLAAVVAACDESFEPIAPSALAFSVFGYLDASADTQWIRVMPIRPLRVPSRDALAATVTLEQLGTGQRIALRDSLFRFSRPSDPDLGAEGTYVHNFWTPEEIEPGAAYRFSARREGKEPAEAVVEIPRDYEVEVDINQFPTHWPPDELRITGVPHVPFFTTIARFYDVCGSSETRTPYERSSADDQAHLFVIGKPEVIPRGGCGRPVVESWEFRIVGSTAAWPTAGYSPGALGESSLTSNVTNAVGFLGGVLTKVIPYEACEFRSDGTPVPNYCRLRYTTETVTLSGTVREQGCRGAPIGSVTVQLTEMDRAPARIRTVFSTRAGAFLIGALEPGIPHLLQARAPSGFADGEPIDVYGPHTDTLTFIPGQQGEYDIHLERLTPCGQPPSAAP
jgi:hypothetical protein